MICISTTRLCLRPFSEQDAPETLAAITEGLTRFMDWEPPSSPEEFFHVWRAWIPAMEAGSEFYFVIRAASELIGLAGLHRLNEGQPELGIWIKETAQGQGYGYEAIAALMEWAAHKFGQSAFIWPVACENAASRALAEKLGGTLVGTFHRTKYAGVIYRIPAFGENAN